MKMRVPRRRRAHGGYGSPRRVSSSSPLARRPHTSRCGLRPQQRRAGGCMARKREKSSSCRATRDLAPSPYEQHPPRLVPNSSTFTLEWIANNPDIEGEAHRGDRAGIRRHADYELLYDKPYEDGPRRPVSEWPPEGAPRVRRGRHLHRAAISRPWGAGQQGRRAGERRAVDRPAVRHHRPQVHQRSCAGNNSGDIDVLCVVGFSFDPTAIERSSEEMPTSPGQLASIAGAPAGPCARPPRPREHRPSSWGRN